MASSTDKTNSSDIVIIPDNSSVPATRTKRKPKESSALTNPTPPTTPTTPTTPIAKKDMTEVAIVAADAPFIRAAEVFKARHQENFTNFMAFVDNVQTETAGAVIDQLCDHYGVTEESLYEQ